MNRRTRCKRHRGVNLGRPPIVEIIWTDTATTYGWRESPSEADTLKVRTSGYLVGRTRKIITVAQSNGQNGDWAELTVIPRSNIKSIRLVGRSRVSQVETE